MVDEDEMTTDTLTTKAVLTPDGLCAKHPHVRLRGRDGQGHVFQRDSCYECDREFAQARRALQERQQDLDRQLQALDTKAPSIGSGGGGGGSGSARKKVDTSTSSHSTMPAMPSPYPYYPPPPPPYYGAYPHPHAHPYPGSEGPHYPPPFGYPPPYPPPQLYQPPLQHEEEEPPKRATAPGPSSPPPEAPRSSKDDFMSQGQVQAQAEMQAKWVAMLEQKEEQLTLLREQLEENKEKLAQETLDLTKCQQQLEQQTQIAEMLQTQHAQEIQQQQESFEQQLQASNQQLEQQSQVTELLQKQLEQLQMAFQQQLQSLVDDSQQQRDYFRQLIQEEIKTLKQTLIQEIKDVQVHSPTPVVVAAPVAPTVTSTAAAATSNSAGLHLPPPTVKQAPPPPPAAMAAAATPKLDKPKMMVEPDDLDQSTVATAEMDNYDPMTSPTVKELAARMNGGGQPKKAPPAHQWTAAGTGAANTGAPVSLKQAPPNTKDMDNEPDEEEELHMSADESLWSASNEGADSNETDKRDDNKKTVPAIAAASDRFTPKYVHPGDDDDDISHHPGETVDERSVEQTVASSTYGEDRQKVVNKQLLDPYGDKGVYTGVILRSTGMPHGLGRMIYDEDGRIYEGDW